MLDDRQLKDVKKILGDLYIRYGLTEEVIRLSQWIDEIVVKYKKKNI